MSGKDKLIDRFKKIASWIKNNPIPFLLIVFAMTVFIFPVKCNSKLFNFEKGGVEAKFEYGKYEGKK